MSENATNGMRGTGHYPPNLRYPFKHGEGRPGKRTPEYKAWISMKERCFNPRNKDWPRWGGKGVKVCEEWRNDYPAFLAHIGRRPSPKHSVDRYPNPFGHYEPGNVRWATAKEQQNNRRYNRPPRKPKVKATHCKNGHPLDIVILVNRPIKNSVELRERRRCSICASAASLKWYYTDGYQRRIDRTKERKSHVQ